MPKPSLSVVVLALVASSLSPSPSGAAQEKEAGESGRAEFRLLATTRTSTLEEEIGLAADAGYRLAHMMGGSTAFGGNEIVAVMARDADRDPEALYSYRLLATNKTSTMQKEMSEAAEAGYVFRAQSVAETAFGGREILVAMERAPGVREPRAEYLLLATNKTSTMQKELGEAGAVGYGVVGMTVAKTLFGGEEVVAILERPAR